MIARVYHAGPWCLLADSCTQLVRSFFWNHLKPSQVEIFHNHCISHLDDRDGQKVQQNDSSKIALLRGWAWECLGKLCAAAHICLPHLGYSLCDNQTLRSVLFKHVLDPPVFHHLFALQTNPNFARAFPSLRLRMLYRFHLMPYTTYKRATIARKTWMSLWPSHLCCTKLFPRTEFLLQSITVSKNRGWKNWDWLEISSTTTETGAVLHPLSYSWNHVRSRGDET